MLKQKRNYAIVLIIVFSNFSVIITFMLSIITHYINIKKVSHVKILKHYNLIM
jgi:hypothetical protein